MILPTKYIPENNTLLAVGGILLNRLKTPMTLTALWNKVKREKSIGSFERFILAIDFLYMIGIVSLEKGLLVKKEVKE
ncbi:MAG: hypothetical protein IJH67_08110 [Thermoguttaceae bacterium]|nr:hypothetical protein [bacterium]MBQ6616318.1 hypothetical protein [Thermoguttaceae bacterium]